MHYFVSFLVLERAGCFALCVFLVSRDCYVALPSDTTVCLQFVIVVITDHTHYFCNHLDEEKRAGCFALIVFLMYCYC